MNTRAAVHMVEEPAGFDLLRAPVVGRFLKWRYGRRILQAVVLVLAMAMILHGLYGPQLAPRNLATIWSWVHFRGLLVLVLLAAGNLFCMACPFTFSRDLARRFFKPALHWPARLRNKWVGIGLFVAILFAYEYFDLWGVPAWTAWLAVGYFAGAIVVDSVFKNASFCKYVCPIGQFNFVASTLSPLEVKVRDLNVCATCTTIDCIKGRRDSQELVLQRGCELALFQPAKVGNLDCTFCLDCVQACPYDNVGIQSRLPGAELWGDERRSGIGRPSRRADISVLALVFTFGALLNAFGMVSPVYAVQSWLAGVMDTTHELPVLSTLFVAALIVEPAVLLGLAGFATQRLTRTGEGVLPLIVKFAYAFIPLGLGIWLAHYSFHLLTGLWTFIPVVQSLFADLGLPIFGPPDWTWGGLPEAVVFPVELGFLALGLIGSLAVSYRIAEREFDEKSRSAFAPWAVLCIVLWGAALWLLNQPMEMRGTFLGG